MQHKIHNLTKTRTLSDPKPNGVDVLEELIAEEGMKLTQNEYIPIQERIIASAVMLGKGRSADEWIEITQEEADKILNEQEELREKEMEKLSNPDEE